MSGSGPYDKKAAQGRLATPGGQAPAAEAMLVVGIGASAGGLEPCKTLVAALRTPTDMAFILVQHLDPTHETLMVALLAGHTPLTVRLATNGMLLERDHLYVIPPGAYLSVSDGALHLTQPSEHQGARLPFDHLLHSMAMAYGARAACVILSGGGGDGSLGLDAIKKRGGLVIVQDPIEAAYDGMPRAAIRTGRADMVLSVADIPVALAGYRRQLSFSPEPSRPSETTPARDRLSEILDLLHAKTDQDFRLYKPGTLERRIERRMAMAALRPGDKDRYFEVLSNDSQELDLLAKDLLIHVTSFFRNSDVFALLESSTVPTLIRDLEPGRPLRVWIAGCSTGEETYSLAMLFHEQAALAPRGIKLQIFASDVDPDAIASARVGFYPAGIAADISPERLARFFSREDDGYRVSPDLRASVVFTVQDVLADPPFSRIDMVSCRNLLIYLGPEAQRKVIALFHFAIRDGGILLLGNAETVGKADDRFEVISEQERLYRHAGRKRAATLALPARGGEEARLPTRASPIAEPSRQSSLADLCRASLLDTYAPAAVLADRNNACVYLFGTTDDYLKAAPGPAVHDVLAMARDGVRSKLRSALQHARREKTRVVVGGGRMIRGEQTHAFSVAVQPVRGGADELMLISFIDEPHPAQRRGAPATMGNAGQMAALERELEALRNELETTIRGHEAFGEEQKAVNEEALSVNEEYQSTNEELISSKEELQSLNEELSALNGQLQETLERQRTTSNDLQNVLYSTDVATLFLDVDLGIRFFTPAVKALFSLIPSDVGRPLSDFTSQAADGLLPIDARTVLSSLLSIEREIAAPSGVWFSRRIMPYRTHGNDVEGVVITFTDITDRKRAAKALEEAKQQAEQANIAKSRFLAAASHDLRQPLQTLILLQSLLVKSVGTDDAQGLLRRSEDALKAMTGMLNTLLDINQIEAGTVSAHIVAVPIAPLLDALRAEFAYHAQAHNLVLRVVPSSLVIETDPRLLEQMLRNLLSNALKYTKRGKVLLGCRRHRGAVRVEVWDTGIGIPDNELRAIFEEYHQLGNAARDRSRGLGLGLSIVQRLSDLLGHRVDVRSREGKGSVFSIEAVMASGDETQSLHHAPQAIVHLDSDHRACKILIVEDDADVRGLLDLFLTGEGHRTAVAPDGRAALDLVARRVLMPDIIIADYNLPGGMDGLMVATTLQERLHRKIPFIILTGDVSLAALRAIAARDCLQLNKPVRPADLSRAVQDLLPAERVAARSPKAPIVVPGLIEPPVIFLVEDDDGVRGSIRAVLEDDGRIVEDFATGESFLASFRPGREACILIDAYMPGMDGIELLEQLKRGGHRLPAIMISGDGDVQMAVHAMRAGASDFIDKPVGRTELLSSVDRALEQARDNGTFSAWRKMAAAHVAGLTARQRQIMALVLDGHPSKNIAVDLGISQRTVENHRAMIMRKTGSKSLPALARLSFAATPLDGEAKP